MDKRGRAVVDFEDVLFGIILLALVYLVVFMVTSITASNVDKLVKQKDEQIRRDAFLVDYLMTPLTQTALAQNLNMLTPQSQEDAKNVLAQDMTIADAIPYADHDAYYLEVLQVVSKINPNLARNTVVIMSSSTQNIISSGTCSVGDTSKAYVPSLDGKTIIVSVKLCT